VEDALSPSKASICSSALNLLGEASIASLEEDSDTARVCAQLYDTTKHTLISEYDWSFSKTKVKLARLVASPTSRWRHQFAMPTDRVSDVFALLPSSAVGAYTVQDFEMQGNSLLSNATELWLDYQYDVPEGSLPRYFVRLLEFELASLFAMPITEQPALAAHWREVARGTPSENGRGGYFRTAVNVDARGRPSRSLNSDELIQVRM
jgi:hypothetical protein